MGCRLVRVYGTWLYLRDVEHWVNFHGGREVQLDHCRVDHFADSKELTFWMWSGVEWSWWTARLTVLLDIGVPGFGDSCRTFNFAGWCGVAPAS